MICRADSGDSGDSGDSPPPSGREHADPAWLVLRVLDGAFHTTDNGYHEGLLHLYNCSHPARSFSDPAPVAVVLALHRSTVRLVPLVGLRSPSTLTSSSHSLAAERFALNESTITLLQTEPSGLAVFWRGLPQPLQHSSRKYHIASCARSYHRWPQHDPRDLDPPLIRWLLTAISTSSAPTDVGALPCHRIHQANNPRS